MCFVAPKLTVELVPLRGWHPCLVDNEEEVQEHPVHYVDDDEEPAAPHLDLSTEVRVQRLVLVDENSETSPPTKKKEKKKKRSKTNKNGEKRPAILRKMKKVVVLAPAGLCGATFPVARSCRFYSQNTYVEVQTPIKVYKAHLVRKVLPIDLVQRAAEGLKENKKFWQFVNDQARGPKDFVITGKLTFLYFLVFVDFSLFSCFCLLLIKTPGGLPRGTAMWNTKPGKRASVRKVARH